MSDKSKIYDYIKRTINPYGKPFKGTAYDLGVKIMDFIENMDDEKENGWIPADKKLPEECVPVNIVWINRSPETYYSKNKRCSVFFDWSLPQWELVLVFLHLR